jgi:ParB/RepB/Spo0J family partition protein
VVRPAKGEANGFEIIAGERRWRAAQRARLHEVPIVVLEVDDGEALELAIIENVQRTDLNPLEEALGYQSLVDHYKHSQDDIAGIVGKSRSHVSNTLRLLKLPDSVKAYINAGKITAGHARALIGQPNPEALAHEIVSKGLNVRQIEQARQDQNKGGKKGKAGKKRKGPEHGVDGALARRHARSCGRDQSPWSGRQREDQVQGRWTARRRSHAGWRDRQAVTSAHLSYARTAKVRTVHAQNRGLPASHAGKECRRLNARGASRTEERAPDDCFNMRQAPWGIRSRKGPRENRSPASNGSSNWIPRRTAIRAESRQT